MIEKNSISWAKPLYSQWLVETNETPETWSAWMGEVADSNDSWFVCYVRKPYQGWMDKTLWPWLDARAT
jgi:hypothetical protein